MILSVAAPLVAAFIAVAPVQQEDQTSVVQRIASIAALASQEYAIGVRGGRVVAPEEVAEARLFLQEARRSAALLPSNAAPGAIAEVDTLLAMIGRTATAESLARRSTALAEGLASRFQVSLDVIPAQPPMLAAGAELYRTQCAACHGATGMGDGLAGRGLSPAPANLTDPLKLANATPLDFFRRISLGVAGTTMPSYETRLSPDQRWALALYTSTLRLPAPRGEVPLALREFATTARLSDAELALRLHPDSIALDQVAAVRQWGAGSDHPAAGPVFAAVRRQLDSAVALSTRGAGEQAGTAAFDAYMTFEAVEREVRAKNPALAADLETGFATLRTRASTGASAAEVRAIQAGVLADLENAERTVADHLSPVNLFTQSFVLLLREGLEAILVVGALMAFLLKTGAGHRRRDIHIGVGAAVGASLLTALLLETIFEVSQTSQEGLEGGVMLVATAMLFYVSYWLLSRMEVAKWNRFVKSQMQDAVTSGSSFALASVAFLAVYREGFETVLFYKALLLSGSDSLMPVLGGMLLGALALAAAYYAINRFGVKIPLKPFFGVTSAFLYYMAFVFAGKGIAELQEGGLIGTTILPWGPRVPALGIYPTLESLLLQGVLLLLLIVGLTWTFVVEPRRKLAITNVLVPDPAVAITDSRPLPVPSPVEPALVRRDKRENDMLRSLERMDADLAELRSEVERLKDLIRRSSTADS